MEIVKPLKGPNPEELDYDFEEHYLQEDKEETNKRKKGTFFTLIGLIVISILGYFGYKNFNTQETVSTSTEQKEIVKISPIIQNEAQLVSTPSPLIDKKNEVIVQLKAKIKSITPIKEETPKVEKIVTYTEVLAQELEPIVSEKAVSTPVIIKEKIKVSTPPKIAKKRTIKKQIAKKKIVKRVIKKSLPKKKVKKRIISRKSRIATVKRGDTLALISKRFYGTRNEFQRIIRANKSIKSHKTSLKIGQKIIIPSLIAPKKRKVTSKKKRIVTVKRGDTLNIIAQRYYGDSMNFKGIIRANKNIRSSKSRLKLGQKIIVPYLPKSQRRRFVTVKKGYSLAYISKKFYGNTSEIKRIVNANHNIKSAKSTLRIGQKVYVPR